MLKAANQVAIVCDGNERIGFGHIRRSSALARRLQEQNISVSLYGVSMESQRFLPQSVGSFYDADVVVFDAPGIEEQLIEAMRHGCRTVGLDYIGQSIPDINVAIYPREKPRALRKSYSGFEYVIIRDEILQGARLARRGDRVVVCLGGADVLSQGPEAAERLRGAGFKVTLIRGPLTKDIPSREVDYEVVSNPDNFAELLASALAIVSNGGGCLFEALYLRKEVFVLPQSPAEERIATYLRQERAVSGVGFDELKAEKFAIEPSSERPLIVDGRGLERLSVIIQELL